MRQGRAEASVTNLDVGVSPRTVVAWTAAGLAAVMPGPARLMPFKMLGDLTETSSALPFRAKAPLLPVAQRIVFDPDSPLPQQPGKSKPDIALVAMSVLPSISQHKTPHVAAVLSLPSAGRQPSKAVDFAEASNAEPQLQNRMPMSLIPADTGPLPGFEPAEPVAELITTADVQVATGLGIHIESNTPPPLDSANAVADLATGGTPARFPDPILSPDGPSASPAHRDYELVQRPAQGASPQVRQHVEAASPDPQSGERPAGVIASALAFPDRVSLGETGSAAPASSARIADLSVAGNRTDADSAASLVITPTRTASSTPQVIGKTPAGQARPAEPTLSKSAVSEYRMTSRGVEFSTVARTHSVSNQVRLLIADDESILVRLSDVLDLVRPLMPPLQFERFAGSANASQFISLNELREAGIPVRFLKNDELAMGDF